MQYGVECYDMCPVQSHIAIIKDTTEVLRGATQCGVKCYDTCSIHRPINITKETRQGMAQRLVNTTCMLSFVLAGILSATTVLKTRGPSLTEQQLVEHLCGISRFWDPDFGKKCGRIVMWCLPPLTLLEKDFR